MSRLADRTLADKRRTREVLFQRKADELSQFSTLAEARHGPEAQGWQSNYAWALLAGLLVPVLVGMIGLLAVLLNSAETGPEDWAEKTFG